MPGKLGLWYTRKLFNNVLQSLKASHPQLVTVVCGCHEGHADKVRQMQHQQISYKDRGQVNPELCKVHNLVLALLKVSKLTKSTLLQQVIMSFQLDFIFSMRGIYLDLY